eukprot:CAMPEP_0201282214 /NCGR_PEP_ID=MMETSP1317-20130820/5061_1 /ASSEMBLY_ACC=CAM_ASM_000770 /TAXON_ID=187299 /ORGANISM="Undescribed Undescribed, Strain Undescribed" /LENGTH=152 /DNA_ID=CAMNT_0047594241 /DNA_START=300 /DNA_END=758 /DNA_ORIENTATION=+
MSIYDEPVMARYRESTEKAMREGEYFIQAPHLFQMGEAAYAAIREEGNQAIIISGESGSGKTEATKYILRYLAESSYKKVAEGQQSLSDASIEKQVLDSNPVLEAFGNAKTLRNDNSSRFGKYIEVHFQVPHLKLYSAKILNYLLEKSRLVK